MANFDEALKFMLSNEGGYSDHPNDSGGKTNLGISEAFLHAIGDDRDPKSLSYDDAKHLYKEHFWFFSTLECQEVANKAFDISVNMGLKSGVKILQISINDCCQPEIYLEADGLIGPKTSFAANFAHPELLLNFMRLNSVRRYAGIVNKNPKQKVFLLGWVRRALL